MKKIYKTNPERRFYKYKQSAKKRGYAFYISYKYAVLLFMQPCYYCGVTANPLNGIDRVDNTQGYSESNCVPCCKVCNRAKSSMGIDEFESWLKGICEFRRQKK